MRTLLCRRTIPRTSSFSCDRATETDHARSRFCSSDAMKKVAVRTPITTDWASVRS